MGLAASQARLLSLTSRQHSVEAEAQRLQHNKMRLSNDSDKAYKVYLNALNDTALKTLQTNSETGDTTWIDGSINNLLRYQTSDDTTGEVFYVQDMETGKLHIPEEFGNKYDIATGARNFAEQFGITYEKIDLNEDVKIDYNNAVAKGWNTLMTSADLEAYYDARNKDIVVQTAASLMMNFVPQADGNGNYLTYSNQKFIGINFIEQAKTLISADHFTTAYTTQEQNVIKEALNCILTLDGDLYRDNSETVTTQPFTIGGIYYPSMPATITKTYQVVSTNGMTSGGTELFFNDGEKCSDNDKLELMLNGGTVTRKDKETTVVTYHTIDVTMPATVTDGEYTKNVYTAADTSALAAYGAANYGEALNAIFARVSASDDNEKAFLDSKGLTKEDAVNYLKFIDLKAAYEAYMPLYEYIPSDTVKAPYYEQIYNAINAAGGWIGASEGRCKNATWVQNMIKNAQVILTTFDNQNQMLSKTSSSLHTSIKEVSDKARIEKASQDYEAELDKINHKDTYIDKFLSKLESERSALTTEIDSLENVMKNNIDKNFKIMG